MIITFIVACSMIMPQNAIFEPTPKENIKPTRSIEHQFETTRAKELEFMGIFSASGYDICLKCCGKLDGITSSGEKAKVGETIAVDPGVIPIGTKVYIDGIGYRTAQDTGGAIKGNKIDILFETHQEALDFGRQKLKIWRVE